MPFDYLFVGSIGQLAKGCLSPERILKFTDLIVFSPKGLQQVSNPKKDLNKAVGAILAQSNKFRSNEETEKDGCLIGQLKAKDGNHGRN